MPATMLQTNTIIKEQQKYQEKQNKLYTFLDTLLHNTKFNKGDIKQITLAGTTVTLELKDTAINKIKILLSKTNKVTIIK